MRERGTRKNSDIPDWARQERHADMGWIGENAHIFWPAATVGFQDTGRGAVVVDTELQIPGHGNPFAYFPQELIEEYDDEDTKRLVGEYDPKGLPVFNC